MDSSGASNASSEHGNIDVDSISKELLQNQRFLGQFTEKIYVPSLDGYRNIIILNAADNENFSRNLDFVKNRLHKMSPLKWIGITLQDTVAADSTIARSPVNYSWIIWTKLPADIPFGEYHFQVKNIRFKQNEIYLKVKVVFDRNAIAESEPIQFTWEDVSNAGRGLINGIVVQSRVFVEWMRTIEITPETIWFTLKYLAVIVLIIGALALQALQFIGRFTLVSFGEIRKFLRVLMPLLLRIVTFAERCVGGFFILVSMVWKDFVYGLRGIPAPRQRVYQPINNRPHNRF